MSSRFSDSAYQHYIGLLQNIINRMASSSSACKSWLITILSAIITICVSTGDITKYIWIAYLPSVLFYILDCFYLGHEHNFRNVERHFVSLIANADEASNNHSSLSDTKKALYEFSLPDGHKDKQSVICQTVKAMASWSTTPFYFLIIAIIFCIQIFFQF